MKKRVSVTSISKGKYTGIFLTKRGNLFPGSWIVIHYLFVEKVFKICGRDVYVIIDDTLHIFNLRDCELIIATNNRDIRYKHWSSVSGRYPSIDINLPDGTVVIRMNYNYEMKNWWPHIDSSNTIILFEHYKPSNIKQ